MQESGDKFAARHSQMTTVGRIVSAPPAVVFSNQDHDADNESPSHPTPPHDFSNDNVPELEEVVLNPQEEAESEENWRLNFPHDRPY